MAFSKIAIVLLACIAVAAASTKYYVRNADDSSEARDAQYKYHWTVKARDPVKSGYGSDDSGETYSKTRSLPYGQSETRNGKRTEGKYTVLLPDGRLQTVEYVVDGDSGYLAKVSYSNDMPSYTRKY